jgi:hypothetical protein
MHQLSCLVPIAPVVAGSNAALANVEVLGVVDVSVRARLYSVDDLGKISQFLSGGSITNGDTYSWLEVDQDGPWDVARVVALVVEDIFAIAALRRKVLEVPVLTDAVLLAKLLPELTADFAPS